MAERYLAGPLQLAKGSENSPDVPKSILDQDGLTLGQYLTEQASKHAVLGLTKTAAVEYGRYGIRVNAVSPGAVRTEMLLSVFGSEDVDRMGAVHPLGRIGRPEEIADAVAWLFSNESSYFTGQSLTLDGGLTAQRPSGQRDCSLNVRLSREKNGQLDRVV
jgi:NAD(P)-dependent dehydrogenase (short-subunit alcohol dehydrogenase family)